MSVDELPTTCVYSHASSDVSEPTSSAIFTHGMAAQAQMQEHNGKIWQLFWAHCLCENKPYTTVSCKPPCNMYESLGVLTLKPESS